MMKNKESYIVIECEYCGVLQSHNLTCPICKKRCKKVKELDYVKLIAPDIIDDTNIKRDDLGILVLTKNEDNKLYNIEFSGVDMFGIFDLTIQELRFIKKLINKELKKLRERKKE